jgi:hypothetical protein
MNRRDNKFMPPYCGDTTVETIHVHAGTALRGHPATREASLRECVPPRVDRAPHGSEVAVQIL